MPNPSTIAAALLLFLLPLWYSPLTQDLDLQKNLVLSLGLCAASWYAGPWSALFLALGAFLAVLFPQGAAVILPLFSLPLLVSFFRQHPPGRWLLGSTSLVALLAALQGVGLDLFTGSTGAFSLPYRVLTASLGNPNYLALFLLFSVVLFTTQAPPKTSDASVKRSNHQDRRMLVWGLCLLLVVAWSRSFLGWGLLTLFLGGVAAQYRQRLALAFGAGAALLAFGVFREGALRALEGRLYLTRVHLSSISSEVWLRGVGPGQEATSFLHWQAAFLQEHPDQLRFWSFPEYAHNDLLSVSVTWGVPIAILLLWLAYTKNRYRAAPPQHARLLSLVLLSLASLGATLLFVSPVLVVAAALFAQHTEATDRRTWRFSRALALVASLALLAVTTLQAVSDWHLTRATKAGMAHQFETAQQALDAAKALPFQEAQALFLQGRILLEQQRFAEAKDPLLQASKRFPHPEVFRPLAFVCLQTNDLTLLSEVLAQWRVYAPNDKTLENFKDL